MFKIKNMYALDEYALDNTIRIKYALDEICLVLEFLLAVLPNTNNVRYVLAFLIE